MMKRLLGRIPVAFLLGLIVAETASSFLSAALPESTPRHDRITNSVGMDLVRIMPGTFLCYGHKVKAEFLFPQPAPFQVNIKQGFYIGAYEVTRQQYCDVMGGAGQRQNDPKHPMTGVNWHEAAEFCRRLSSLPAEKAAGRVYSLPTEREWQFAARAGSEYLFPYGSDDEQRVAEVAVCRDPYSNSLPQGTSSVGARAPNAWGLYDVLGNAWEWVDDAWPAAAPANAVSPGPSSKSLGVGENRVIVGGGWDNDFRMCNLASRYSAPPTRKADNIGFRVRCEIRGARQ